jgi:hypothetical protein
MGRSFDFLRKKISLPAMPGKGIPHFTQDVL